MNLKELKNIELVKLHCQVVDELISRGVAQTRNQPVSEYAKWLIIQKLKLTDVKNPNEKFDGLDQNGNRYLIRSRQKNDSQNVQFGIIRNLDARNFDYLIAITFDNNVALKEAYIIPYDTLVKSIRKNDYQNGHTLNLNKLNLSDPQITDIRAILASI